MRTRCRVISGRENWLSGRWHAQRTPRDTHAGAARGSASVPVPSTVSPGIVATTTLTLLGQSSSLLQHLGPQSWQVNGGFLPSPFMQYDEGQSCAKSGRKGKEGVER